MGPVSALGESALVAWLVMLYPTGTAGDRATRQLHPQSELCCRPE